MESERKFNDEFDYEKIEAILEEEERNKRKRREDNRRVEKRRDDSRSRDNKYRDREKDRYRDKDRDRDRDKDRDRDRRNDRYMREDSRDKNRRRSHSRSKERNQRRDYRDRDRDRERRDKDKHIMDKTIEEARRQAIEAQRDDCTILVYRLHLDAKEKDLFRFFTGANIGRVIDIKVIRDPRTGRSKGAAYVEFESQESVLLAVAMSGQQVMGQSVTIQNSQAEKNRLAAAAKYKKEMIKEQYRINSSKPLELPALTERPMRIYVGGLTESLADITDIDLRNIFTPFGEIDLIDMPRDALTHKSKGYCYIQYRKESQAQSAISAMNGFKYRGKLLKVGEANEGRHGNEVFTHTGEMEEDSHLHNAQSKIALMQKLNRDLPYEPATNDYRPNVSSNTMNVQSGCILLSNLFDPAAVNLKEEPNFYSETREDVFEECSGFGKVENVYVDTSSSGNVLVKFANNNWQAARAALESLNGRWFASRAIIAKSIPDNVFEDQIRKI